MTDEMLTQMIREACELEFEEIERRIEAECPHIFSEEFNRKIDRIVKQEYDSLEDLNPQKPIRFGIRYILIAVLLLIVGTSTVMGHSFFQERIQDLIYTVFPEYIRIENPQAGKDAKISESSLKKPAYVPKGFHIIREDKEEEAHHYMISWEDEEDHIIHYMQTGIDTTVALTSNGEKPKEVHIGNIVGKLSVDKEGSRSLFFEKDKNIFTIVGPVSEKEIIRMAESIQ